MPIESRRWLLLSIKPEHALRIFTGEKRAELRRTCPALEQGDFVLVYASQPRKALIGFFEVEATIQETPEELWARYGKMTAVPRHAFDTYLEGARSACAILIAKAYPFDNAVPLDRIRSLLPRFHPPRGYAYLAPDSSLRRVLLGLAQEAIPFALTG